VQVVLGQAAESCFHILWLQLQGLVKRMAKFIGEVRNGNLLPLYMRAEAKSLEERARGLLKDA
jgi:hypothetical protein